MTTQKTLRKNTSVLCVCVIHSILVGSKSHLLHVAGFFSLNGVKLRRQITFVFNLMSQSIYLPPSLIINPQFRQEACYYDESACAVCDVTGRLPHPFLPCYDRAEDLVGHCDTQPLFHRGNNG